MILSIILTGLKFSLSVKVYTCETNVESRQRPWNQNSYRLLCNTNFLSKRMYAYFQQSGNHLKQFSCLDQFHLHTDIKILLIMYFAYFITTFYAITQKGKRTTLVLLDFSAGFVQMLQLFLRFLC